LSVQPGLRVSNDLRVGRKMANFQLFFQSGRDKDLSAPLYVFPKSNLYIRDICCLLACMRRPYSSRRCKAKAPEVLV